MNIGNGQATPHDGALSILQTLEDISQLQDVDAILDCILFNARRVAAADAGSIFLVRDYALQFDYTQNDTLFRDGHAGRSLYENITIPINEKSIVGHTALTNSPVVVADAYHIPPGVPYSFNPAYDLKSGYRTVSIMALPMRTFQNRLIGVMQLINARNGAGAVVPFSEASQRALTMFAQQASVVVERGLQNREMVLRMVRLAELRDPRETGMHVQRVGAYAAELYQRWAVQNGVAAAEARRNRDLIRLAAMLHDVGKVGVSDTIIKKPGKLTGEEFAAVQRHALYGGQLFARPVGELDVMSRDIALHHHERWDGGGYPGAGAAAEPGGDEIRQPLRGNEIPLAARITALADVFDALVSRRSYKEPWTDEQVFAEIRKCAGTQFDPELVAVFFEITDTLLAIREKFRD